MHRRNHAFTLVEVSLALLVVAVGVLGAFALFPAGLSTNKRAIEDTQSAMFAEMVFGGYRALAGNAKSSADWAALNTQTITTPGWLATAVWSGSAPKTIGPSASLTIFQAQVMARVASDELTLQYQLNIGDVSPSTKYLRLLVVPGLYGKTRTNFYYTEILNTTP